MAANQKIIKRLSRFVHNCCAARGSLDDMLCAANTECSLCWSKKLSHQKRQGDAFWTINCAAVKTPTSSSALLYVIYFNVRLCKLNVFNPPPLYLTEEHCQESNWWNGSAVYRLIYSNLNIPEPLLGQVLCSMDQVKRPLWHWKPVNLTWYTSQLTCAYVGADCADIRAGSFFFFLINLGVNLNETLLEQSKLFSRAVSVFVDKSR